jgi:hypothetical protein
MDYRTPNSDRLATEGIRFTDSYGEQSCTAGRSSFITGQSVYRTGLSKVGVPASPIGLQAEDPTIAELLKPLGYATGQSDKDHLGDLNKYLPTAHGFDEFYGNLSRLNCEEEPKRPTIRPRRTSRNSAAPGRDTPPIANLPRSRPRKPTSSRVSLSRDRGGGLPPRLVHARKAKLMMGEINKTDKLDVRGLNRLQQAGTLPTVWIPPGELRDQRDLPRTRVVIQRLLTLPGVGLTLAVVIASRWGTPRGLPRPRSWPPMRGPPRGSTRAAGRPDSVPRVPTSTATSSGPSSKRRTRSVSRAGARRRAT